MGSSPSVHDALQAELETENAHLETLEIACFFAKET